MNITSQCDSCLFLKNCGFFSDKKYYLDIMRICHPTPSHNRDGGMQWIAAFLRREVKTARVCVCAWSAGFTRAGRSGSHGIPRASACTFHSERNSGRRTGLSSSPWLVRYTHMKANTHINMEARSLMCLKCDTLNDV